jgi:DHA2 family multidrug resistance protein
VQVVGFPFLFVPINLAAYVGMPADKASSMAGLLNFTRNIGSAIGTSMVTTLIARQAQVHQVQLAAHATAGNPTFTQTVAALAHRLQLLGLDAASATSQAYARLYQALVGQATALAYIDTFQLMAGGAGLMFLLSFALRRNQPGGGPVAAH